MSEVSLNNLYDVENNDVIIKCLVDNKLLNNKIKCKKCNIEMAFVVRQCLDGYAWRCPSCRTFKSLRTGSFFENLRFNLRNIIKMIYYFSIEMSQTKTAKELNVSRSSIVDFFHKLKYVCVQDLKPDEIVLGGPNKVVEIDESLFARAKHNRGKDLKRKQFWVFGMKQRDSGRIYMKFVGARNAANLLPIIYKHVAPESIIYSDLWKSYKAIPLVILSIIIYFQTLLLNNNTTIKAKS